MRRDLIRDESGQTAMEYLMVVIVIVSVFSVMVRQIREMGLVDRMLTPITEDFAAAYKYGHPRAKGPADPGGPKMHPRVVAPDNFRMVLNPRADG